MSNETQTQTETAIPSMTLEKVNSVVANLVNYVATLLKTDKKHHAGLRVQAAIEDTINTNISDELRYDMYQMLRQTAKVWSMAEHLPQRISKASITENEQNYNAQTALTVQNWFDNAGMPPAQYRRPAHVDKDKGEVAVARNYDQENWIARILNDYRRSDGNQYNADETYSAVVEEVAEPNTEAQTDEVEG